MPEFAHRKGRQAEFFSRRPVVQENTHLRGAFFQIRFNAGGALEGILQQFDGRFLGFGRNENRKLVQVAHANAACWAASRSRIPSFPRSSRAVSCAWVKVASSPEPCSSMNSPAEFITRLKSTAAPTSSV